MAITVGVETDWIGSDVQMFVDCLVVSGFCPRVPGPNGIFRRPQPSDFASIDLDEDSVQQEQPLEIIAFVSGDYPVLFETNLGDGVVAVRLVTGETDPRGDGTVTVTQNGIAKQSYMDSLTASSCGALDDLFVGGWALTHVGVLWAEGLSLTLAEVPAAVHLGGVG